MDDLRDPYFELVVAVSDRLQISIGMAIILFAADLFFSSELKSWMVLFLHVGRPMDIVFDFGMSVLQFLSLIVIRFIPLRDSTSLLIYCGIHVAVHLCWRYIASLTPQRKGSDGLSQIYIDACVLLVYCLAGLALCCLELVLLFLLRPVQTSHPILKAIYATILFEAILVALTPKTYLPAYRALRGRISPETSQKSSVGDEAEGDNYYRYRKLEQSGEIRLLRLWPGTDSSEIRCDLVHASLGYYQPYEAISYTWATLAKTHNIIVSDSPLRVTWKVHQVLRKLRGRWHSRLLWIDSVSINQDDLEERSQQVLLMRHIYYRATKVVVWLGDASDAHEAARISAGMAAFIRAHRWSGGEVFREYSQEKHKAQLAALSTLLQNDWFARIWIVQEVAVARDLSMLYGTEQIMWQDLRDIIQFCLGSAESLPLIQRTSNSGVRTCDHKGLRASQIFNVRIEVTTGTSRDLSFYLESFRSFGATDPRDKVFAVVGLAKTEHHPLVTPDYRKTVRDVYVDAARYLFTVETASCPLRTLSFAGIGCPRRHQSLPSWVPNWSATVIPDGEKDSLEEHSASPISETIGNIGNLRPAEAASSPNTHLVGNNKGYKAALETKAIFQVASDSETMTITGFHVDEIARLSSVLRYPFDADMRISTHKMLLLFGNWIEEVEDMVNTDAKAPYPNGQSKEDVIWRTMIGDRDWQGPSLVRPAPDDHREGFRLVKTSYKDTLRESKLVDLDTLAELGTVMREVCFCMMNGESPIPLLWKVLTGQSGHESLWAILGARTKPGVEPPELPPLPEEEAPWLETLFQITAGTDVQDALLALVNLLDYLSPHDSEARQNAQDSARPENILRVGRFSQATRMSYERRFCVTRDGYVGIVPPLTEVGDQICIFYGIDTPYTVRQGQSLEKFALVGECYIHGMMDGELMGLAEENERSFVLE